MTLFPDYEARAAIVEITQFVKSLGDFLVNKIESDRKINEKLVDIIEKQNGLFIVVATAISQLEERVAYLERGAREDIDPLLDLP